MCIRDRDSKDRKILFVCLGNICRSPSAEAILKHLLEKRGNSADWEIDSAGILDLHNGLRSDSRGLKVLKKHGIANPHRARQVHEDDFSHFDVIMAFDDSNVEDLKEFRPTDGTARAKVKLFGTYDPKGQRTMRILITEIVRTLKKCLIIYTDAVRNFLDSQDN